MNGYGGTLLRVDLSSGRITKTPLPQILAEDYLGGRGFGAYLLYREVPPGADPLGPENKLFASTGPLSGTLFPGACKMDFAAKSPLTGGYGSSSVGGKLAAELKFAGFDAIIVEGAGERPAYLYIDDDRVELREATHLWGMGAVTAEQVLKSELGDDFQLATIGPAGENLVRYACIHHDIGRQAGRCGIGAVMGSKRLKAVAVRGSGSIRVADSEAFLRISRKAYQSVKKAETHKMWVRDGTTKTTEWVNTTGTLPSFNFRAGAFEDAPRLYANVARSYVVADKGCFSCPSPCGKYTYVPAYGTRIEGPDYETIAMLGPNVGLADWEALVQANWLCDELGMDTISAGGSISWAMECFDRGVITAEQTEGIDLNWGSVGGILTLLERIGRRQGWLGNLLAEGSKRAAEAVGQESDKWAIQHKGMEQSAYETHSATAMLLSYMTSDIGGHHGRAWAIWHDISMGRDKSMPEKAAKIIELQHIRPLLDCLGCCRFLWVELGISLESYAEAMQALTGIDRSWDDLLFISERIWNLTRLYWAREYADFGRSYDAPPPRFVSEAATEGPTEGVFTPPATMQKMLDDYYGQRGWDANGLPTAETLERLGLSPPREARR